MVIDKRAEIINESIRRMIDKCMECPELESSLHDNVRELLEPEEMRRLAALNHAMVRIINSAHSN